jgi:hypothetical protein
MGTSVAGMVGTIVASNIAIVSLTGTTGTTLVWGMSGIAALEAGGATGTFAFVTGAAATGIGLGIAAVTTAGVLIYTAVWNREDLINELALNIRNQVN